MRTFALPGLALLLIAACEKFPVHIPTGLSARLTMSAAPGGPPGEPTITAAGDSIVAEIVASTTGCLDYTAKAGPQGEDVVITLTARENERVCSADLANAKYRIVVDDAPEGAYHVTWYWEVRDAHRNQRSVRTLLRQRVDLP